MICKNIHMLFRKKKYKRGQELNVWGTVIRVASSRKQYGRVPKILYEVRVLDRKKSYTIVEELLDQHVSEE